MEDLTVAQIKELSDGVFFNNGQGEIDPAEVRAFNRKFIDFIIRLSATFIIDSDEALADWANNTPGNNYTNVLIKPGVWTSSKEVNLTTAGTKAVTGMPASLLSFTSGYGLRYGAAPTMSEYWMRGVNAKAAGADSDFVCFLNCTNLANCTGASTGASGEYRYTGFKNCTNLTGCTGTGENTGNDHAYCYGFQDCTNLINCTGTATNTGYGASYGFMNCTSLTNCTGTATATATEDAGAVGFFTCTNLVNCTGTGTGVNYGFGFLTCTNLVNCTGTGSGAIVGHGFSGCRIMLFCSGTYLGCYMHATGSTDPVGDTAAGGWNRS
jgi:hypothetical protein